MNRRVLIPAAITCTMLLACQSKETTVETGTDSSMTTVSEMTTSTTSDTPTSTSIAASAPYDLQFLDTMAKHHQMAVEMVTAAGAKFENGDLEALAAKMVTDQNAEIAQLRKWREQWYAGAPPAENMEMPGMSGMATMDMSHMQMMNGKALDVMFIDMMTPHHEGAVAMAQDAIAKAEHQEIKDFSQKVIDAQQKEIAQMQQWKKDWKK